MSLVYIKKYIQYFEAKPTESLKKLISLQLTINRKIIGK